MIPVYSLLLVCVLSLQVHTRPRVQRAPGIPHALKRGREINANLGRMARRGRERVCKAIEDGIFPCKAFQRVVPANAGTHTARTLVSAPEQRPFFTFEARGDGSLRSQGRRTSRVLATNIWLAMTMKRARHTHGPAQENVAATLPSPKSSITTLSPAVSQIVLTRLPVSTISPAERPLPSEAR